MTSIAELGIKVDSTDAAQASSDLDKLTAAGSRAEKAAEGVARGADKASKAIKNQKDELADLLGEIDPTVKALGRLDDLESRLAKQKKLGALDSATFSEYQAKIGQTRDGLTKFDDQLTRTGNTAKQTAAALRGVPAQFTDIAVSLQGGQAPLTVLLQQGGQLKDMFGGIGPAAKALGGYVGGLINPFTAAAGVVGVLTAALLAAQSQFNEYNKAVVSTGGIAGRTGDQLSALATTLANGKNFSEAGAAVLSLAQNGRLTGEVFQEVARAATETAAATGQSASDIADQLSSTKGKVTDLAVEYSNKYGVITQSTYDQIRALEEQGDRMGAIKTLSTAVADEMTRRNKEMEDSTRGLAKAWGEVQKSISGAWNELKTGLQASPELFRLQVLQGQLQDAQELGDKNLVTYYQQQITAAQKAVNLQQQKAALVGQEESSRRQQIAGEDKWQTDGLKYLTSQQKMEKEISDTRQQGLSTGRSQVEIEQRISEIRKSYEKKLSGPANQLDLTSVNDVQNQLKTITSAYSNSQKDLDAQQKAGIISQESYAAQRVALIQAEKEETASAYQAEIAALEAVKGKSSTTGNQRIQLDQKIADARTAMAKASKDADTELSVIATNEEGRLKKQALAVQVYTDALQQQVTTLREQGQRSAATLGMGDRQQGLFNQQNGIDDRINQQKTELANQYGDGSRGMSLEEYTQKLAALNKTQQDLRDTVQSNYDDMTAAQGSWSSGASSAFQNYLESARDVAGQTKSLFTNAFSSMEDAVANFAITGKLSFSDFAKSILADMARIATRQASSTLISSLFGAGLSYFGGSSATSAGSTQAGYTGTDLSGFTPGSVQAKGGAWAGGVQMFANGGAFSNSIVSSPTAFGMAGGQTGVMGEAGPEAIVPLARTSSGALGIRSVGNGSGSNIQISAPVSVVTADRSNDGMQLDQQALQQNLQKQMQAAAEKAVADSWRAGGVSYRNANGRV